MARKTSEILSDEHVNILKVVDVLMEEIEKMNEGGDIKIDFLRDVIDFVRNYADRFHHAKEEDILFKEFCKAAESEEVHCNPVEQMLIEHDMGREFVKGIEEGMEENDKGKIMENARSYIGFIQEHIHKEDNILYPMSDELLSKGVEEKMLGLFKKVEVEKAEDKKRFLEFIKGLKD